MKPFIFLLLAAVFCVPAIACRKRAARVEVPPVPVEAAGVSAPASKESPPPSVYDAGSAQSREAVNKDRRFMKLALAFRDGTSVQRKGAREELQRLPPAERAEFEALCKNMKIPTD